MSYTVLTARGQTELVERQLATAERTNDRLVELIAELERGNKEQARSNRLLLWLTGTLVALTIILALPLVLDGLDWVGLVAR